MPLKQIKKSYASLVLSISSFFLFILPITTCGISYFPPSSPSLFPFFHFSLSLSSHSLLTRNTFLYLPLPCWSCSCTAIIPSARDFWILSTTSPITFQTFPNLRWKSSKQCPFLCQADDRHTPLALAARYWPQFCLLNASSSGNHLSSHLAPIRTSCATQIYLWCYFNTLAKAFLELVTEFSSTEPKLPDLFVP